MTALHAPSLSLPRKPGWAFVAGYVVLFVALDRVSFIDPLGPLGITPWNPGTGLSLFLLLRYGLAMTPWFFAATVVTEVLVHAVPAPWPVIVGASALLAGGYAAVAALLRGRMRFQGKFTTLHDVTVFTAVAVVATLVIALAHLALFAAAGIVGAETFVRSVAQLWIGDLIGVIVVTPLLLVATRARGGFNQLAWGEALLQGGSVAAALFLVFVSGVGHEHKLFYVLFLPLTWIAMRRGLAGTTAATTLVQIGLVVALQSGGHPAGTVIDFQFLMLALALTGLFLGVSVDERRTAEAKLRDKQAELDRSLRAAAASELASTLAHELNQPLSAIGTYARSAQIMLERGDPDGELPETMRKVVAEASRAGMVMRRLREFVLTGAVRLEPLRPAALLEDAAAAARSRAGRHQVLLSTVAAPDLPDVLGDRIPLETVLHNLIANAIDAVKDEAEGRIVRVTAARHDANTVRISVEDEGPGVAPEMAATLFEPLATSKAHGLGLGLPISRTIVEAHGGRLWLEPTARGACFCLTLPVVP